MPPHPLINFEIQKYYQNEPRFNGVYSIDNLPKKIKDGAYVINLDEHSHAGMHWIALYCKNIEIICFVSFGVEHVCKEIEKLIGQKNIKKTYLHYKLFKNVWILWHWIYRFYICR